MPNKGYISPSVRTKLDEVYDFIEQHHTEHGYSASRQDLADAFSVSKSVIEFYLVRMIRLGMLEAPRFGIARNLRLIPRKEK